MYHKTSRLRGFKKGDIICLHPDEAGYHGWRRLSAEEQENWYRRQREEVAAGLKLPYDDAGEPHLAPLNVYLPLHSDRTYEVVRGRVNAPKSYGKATGCCEVIDMLTGERLFCSRHVMVLV